MTNKMTEAELHAVLDGVKEGDVVRVVMEGKAKLSEYRNSREVWIKKFRLLRYFSGALVDNLISIENFRQPEPPEPEVGSFALLKGEAFTISRHVNEGGVGWLLPLTHNKNSLTSWDYIYPNIKVLYHPNGSINEGWKR